MWILWILLVLYSIVCSFDLKSYTRTGPKHLGKMKRAHALAWYHFAFQNGVNVEKSTPR